MRQKQFDNFGVAFLGGVVKSCPFYVVPLGDVELWLVIQERTHFFKMALLCCCQQLSLHGFNDTRIELKGRREEGRKEGRKEGKPKEIKSKEIQIKIRSKIKVKSK